jgi:aminoglycoside 3-N-acetyltransferase
MANSNATLSSLRADLRQLGVETGDLLMVHASMRAIGPIKGRADTLIAALDDTVGRTGGLLMMVSPDDPWSWVNERPEGERASLLVNAELFDAQSAKTAADVGVLAEVFRTLPGTLVSDHPEGRFAARGRLAEELVRDPPWDHYYGPGSALERLVERGGKVLRLGADRNTVTLMHYAEYLADVADKRRVRRHRLVSLDGKAVVRTVDCLDDSDGIVAYASGDYFEHIFGAYLQRAVVRLGRVGNAHSELMDAGDLVRFSAAWMTEHLGRGKQ